jgi:PIN domain nuclease of toxin-antitoxin system
MRLLIDSHALIWFCEGNAALSSIAREAMEDGSNERFISHATPWEMAIKLALGKLQLQSDFAVIFPGVLNANGFAMLTPKLEHYRALIDLPRHHGDPFDRLIIAQAKVDGMAVVTCDPNFPQYGVTIVW